MKPTTFDQELAQHLRDSGMPLTAIAERLGVSGSTIHRRTTAPEKESVDVERMQYLYETEEWTLRDIGTEFGMSYQSVRRILVAAGVKQRGKSKTEQTRRKMGERFGYSTERLQEMADMKMSTLEIAETLGKDEESVRRAMISRGIDRLPAKARQEKNHFWRGGVVVDKHGYILLKMSDHPDASASGYVRQHRYVAAKHLGRDLLPGEVVDHIDGDKSNNVWSNLRVFSSNAEHLAATLRGARNLAPEERALLTEDSVQRAKIRAAAIHLESGIGVDPSL